MLSKGKYFFYGLCIKRDNLITSSTAILNKLSVNDFDRTQTKQRGKKLSNSRFDRDKKWWICSCLFFFMVPCTHLIRFHITYAFVDELIKKVFATKKNNENNIKRLRIALTMPIRWDKFH